METIKKNYVECVLSLIKNNVKIKDCSCITAGPFSSIGLNFDNKYQLRIEKNIISSGSFWKKSVRDYEFFIYNINDDKTIQISKDDFKLICNELKNIDTDTVNKFLSYSFCK